MTKIYEQLQPDPGQKEPRQIEILSVEGEIARFRALPVVDDLKTDICDLWTLCTYWKAVISCT